MRACRRIATKAVVPGRPEPTAKLPVRSVLKPRSGSAPLRMVRSGRVLFGLSRPRWLRKGRHRGGLFISSVTEVEVRISNARDRKAWIENRVFAISRLPSKRWRSCAPSGRFHDRGGAGSATSRLAAAGPRSASRLGIAGCEALSVNLAQRADEGVAVLVADFAVVVAMTIVQTCLAHAALHGGRKRQHPPARLRWQPRSAVPGQLLFLRLERSVVSLQCGM